jgi:hypothetical protein
MSLSAEDLYSIRTIVREEVRQEIKPLEGRIEALENDVKEFYSMLKRLFKKTKLSLN